MMRDDTSVTKLNNNGRKGNEFYELPKYPQFQSKEMKEDFESQFAFRILYKPKEGVLWGYNHFWAPKLKFYSLPGKSQRHNESLNNFSLLHSHSVAEDLNQSIQEDFMMPDSYGKNLIPRHSIELDAQLSLQHIQKASKNENHQDLDTITINYDIN